MEIITQTNRCILFEEMNPEKPDLLTLVGEVKGHDSLNDDKIKEINQQLLVKSFDEFLAKFAPGVYSFYNAATQKVVYTLKKPLNIPDDCISEIKLDQNNDFLKMLFTLIDAKKSQGIKNVDFRFEKVLDMISPQKVLEDIKQVRKEIHYLYQKYEGLEDGDPRKLDLGDKLNYKFEEASQNYNNVLAMLPLAIEDIKTRLLLGRSRDEAARETVRIGMLTMGDHGELKIIEAPQADTTALTVREEDHQGIAAAFAEDYDAITDNPSVYVRDLVVRTFCPFPAGPTEVDTRQEVENYNTYLEFYKTAKDDFVKTAKPLVETILGVKMFFDQYTAKQKGMPPALLVTNNQLDMTVKSSNLPRLETYLNTVNDKNDFHDTVWFGIVPAIEFEASKIVQTRRERFKGNEKSGREAGKTLESLTALLQCVKRYKIQVFFNFQADEETTFNTVATAGVDQYLGKCECLTRQDYSEFAIPCLPNFTIIPKDKSGVVIDSKMLHTETGAQLSRAKEDVLKLWIEGVYVDAAYVAAGIVAAYQCPEYLRQYCKNTHKDLPGVRFDIESGDNNLKVVTTMAKEISGFTNTIKDAINRRNFGFVFSSENAQLHGKDIKRITVYKARGLSRTEDGFDSIYKTLVSTYVERVLRFRTLDFRQDHIIQFFSANPVSQKMQWLDNGGYVNSIIQTGDDINYLIDTQNNICQIDLAFNGNVKNLEVNITKSASAVN